MYLTLKRVQELEWSLNQHYYYLEQNLRFHRRLVVEQGIFATNADQRVHFLAPERQKYIREPDVMVRG